MAQGQKCSGSPHGKRRGSIENQGIWAERSGGLDLVARSGDDATGTSSGVQYSEFGSTTFNNAGQTAFLAWLTGSGVDATATGIWSEGSGNLYLVAREGDRSPGTPDGVVFTGTEDVNEPNDLVPAFWELVTNSAGRTAFLGTLGGTGVDSTNRGGIWSESSGSLELVARTGNHAPGTPDDVKFMSMSGLSMNAAGQTAFKAWGGVDSFEMAGIWATDVNGTLQLVVKTSDMLEVAPSDFRVMSDVSFVAATERGTGNEDGRPSGFNDRGQLAFEGAFHGRFERHLCFRRGAQRRALSWRFQ